MSKVDDEFLQIAKRNGLLDEKTTALIKTVAAERGVAIKQAAIDSGELTLYQVEAVDSLLRPQETVAGYEILSLLGQGGMGVVFRARQLAFDRVVALKMVRLGTANSAAMARFEQEAKTIGRFSHPHIVTAFDFGRADRRLYLAMEYLNGQDADNYVSQHGPLSETVAWSLIRQVTSGLLYAAEHGVTHRDIKPANLLLIEAPAGIEHPPGVPFVKILDFGLALLHEKDEDHTRLTTENSTLGSPQYMAPEQIEGGVVDARADIYALGATAFQLLSGKPPFHGLTLTQLFARKLAGNPQSLAQLRPEISAASLSAVTALMACDQNDRPSDHRAVLQVVNSVLQSLKGEKERSSTQTAVWPTTGNEPSVVGTAALSKRTAKHWGGRIAVGMVIVAVVLGAWMQLSPKTKRSPKWVPTGWSLQCFNGISLNGWRTIRGQWNPGQKDEEGGRVLAGRGIVAYDLPKNMGSEASSRNGFRLVALGQLYQAESISLQLAVPESTAGAERQVFVLQLTKDRVCWGSRHHSEGPLQKTFAERPVSNTGEGRFHEFRIDCQAGEWRVYFDGKLLATQPVSNPRPSEFRLAATSSSADEFAWFSDVGLEELAPPPDSTSAAK